MPRPREAILSRDLIRDQALAIVDETGLESLTMRRLATRLAVQAASLYAHFPNKEAVLDAIADRLAKRIDPHGFADSWQDGLRTWANSYYAAIHWHPNAAPILAGSGRERSDHVAAVSDELQQALVGYGWPPQHAAMVASATNFLVLGAAATASVDNLLDEPSRSRTKKAGGSELDQFADTMERASFTLALDCLIRGLEDVYATVKTSRRRRAAG